MKRGLELPSGLWDLHQGLVTSWFMGLSEFRGNINNTWHPGLGDFEIGRLFVRVWSDSTDER